MKTTNKNAKVVMLPTKKASSLYMNHRDGEVLTLGDNVVSTNHNNWTNQYLYIVSTEKGEVKRDGDWFILFDDFGNVMGNPQQYDSSKGHVLNSGLRKVIATTDSSLFEYNIKREVGGFSGDIPLPQPSQSFIEVFVREYNNDNVISDVMVEYEEEIQHIGEVADESYPKDFFTPKIKINPKDNTIKINKQKEYSMADVIELLTEWGVYLGRKSKDSESYLGIYRDIMKDEVVKWGKETGKF
jgi:hypothetical protein